MRITFLWRETYIAMVVYLTLSGLGFAVLLLLNRYLGYGVTSLLRRWDAVNYLAVAAHGYPDHLVYRADGAPDFNTLAFFPLVPTLIRGLHLAAGLPVEYGGMLVSWVAGAVAASGVHTLARAIIGCRAAFVCVALWACSPYAFVLWIPYSEAVFTAVLMWALVALFARRWGTAGLLCALAGTVRPTAVVLVGVAGLAAMAALMARRDGSRPLATLAIAPLGVVGSWLFLGSRIGSATGWFEAERAWNQSFDFGRATLIALRDAAGAHSPDVRYTAVFTMIAAAAIGTAALSVDRRVPWLLVLLVASAWALMMGTSGAQYSKPRFMLPFLPVLLLPLAAPLSRVHWQLRWLVYASGAVFAGWYGTGLLVQPVAAP
ncbi:hypothetical protein ACIRU3_46290 [Streptomyces sp. NPDC101151]|uniref:hypothetical protein n=1 Tax=Streptomyces sp. NPDC101151 TaxID=3366115 RepID=UPI0037F68024